MIQLWIDTETTGTNEQRDSIVQLSCIVRVNNKEVERHKWDIKPYKINGMDPGAAAVNGITQEMCEAYPDQKIAFTEFIEMCDRLELGPDNKAYFCGYNSNFDLQMVKQWFQHNRRFDLWSKIYTPDMDVMRMAILPFAVMKVREHMPNFKLSTVYETLFNESLEGAHDSMADIVGTLRIYDALIEKYFPETLVN